MGTCQITYFNQFYEGKYLWNCHSINTQIDSVIMSIPDIGFFNGEMILGETGVIICFSNPSKVLAFAGLNSAVYQSGDFNTSHTKMSKRGSRPLRYALINAAHNVVRNNETFKDYYNQKISKRSPIIMP